MIDTIKIIKIQNLINIINVVIQMKMKSYQSQRMVMHWNDKNKTTFDQNDQLDLNDQVDHNKKICWSS